MKKLLTFDEFINENYSWNLEIDANDRDLIKELQYMHSIFKNGVSTEINEAYQENLFDLFNMLVESSEDFDMFEGILNEDEADDIEGDVEYRRATKLGNKGFIRKAASFLSWAAFPVKAPYELIKLIQKKMKIKKLLKNVPDGEKKEKLRQELNNLTKQQVAAVAELKKAREARKWTTKYGDELGGKVKTESEDLDQIKKYLDVFEAKGKISAEDKEKIMKKAESQGKSEGKSQADKAKGIADKLASADKSKQKDAIEKMDKTIEAKKKAWEDVKKKAEAAGITL